MQIRPSVAKCKAVSSWNRHHPIYEDITRCAIGRKATKMRLASISHYLTLNWISVNKLRLQLNIQNQIHDKFLELNFCGCMPSNYQCTPQTLISPICPGPTQLTHKKKGSVVTSPSSRNMKLPLKLQSGIYHRLMQKPVQVHQSFKVGV